MGIVDKLEMGNRVTRRKGTKDRKYEDEAQLYADSISATIAQRPRTLPPPKISSGPKKGEGALTAAHDSRQADLERTALRVAATMQISAKRGNKPLTKPELVAVLMMLDPEARDQHLDSKMSLPEVRGRLRVAMLRETQQRLQQVTHAHDLLEAGSSGAGAGGGGSHYATNLGPAPAPAASAPQLTDLCL